MKLLHVMISNVITLTQTYMHIHTQTHTHTHTHTHTYIHTYIYIYIYMYIYSRDGIQTTCQTLILYSGGRVEGGGETSSFLGVEIWQAYQCCLLPEAASVFESGFSLNAREMVTLAHSSSNSYWRQCDFHAGMLRSGDVKCSVIACISHNNTQGNHHSFTDTTQG